jgi:hypothetical protein
MILYLKHPENITKKSHKSDKNFWQNSRKQYQHTKISSFSMYNNEQAEKKY